MSIIQKEDIINSIKNNNWKEGFDKIYVITIPNKNRSNLEKELSFIPKYSIYTFKPAASIINAGDKNINLYDILNHKKCNSTCQNIMNNHLAIIREAYDNGLDNILILEDDITFKKYDMKPLFNWMKKNDWDVFFLGYCQWPYLISYRVNDTILQLTSPMGTFSYALSRTGMKKILDFSNSSLDNAKHIDKLIGNDIPLTKFGVYPSICFQKEGPALFKKAISKIPFNINLF